MHHTVGMDRWGVRGTKDAQLVRSDWQPAEQPQLEGVEARLISNVLADNGYLTEVWRSEWRDEEAVRHVFQRVLEPGPAGWWHAHARATDRIFCAVGRLSLALYDGRLDSPTHGVRTTYRIGEHRPAVVVVPPGVWHQTRNTGTVPLVFINVVDQAYDYDDPDHWRAPADDPGIAFSL